MIKVNQEELKKEIAALQAKFRARAQKLQTGLDRALNNCALVVERYAKMHMSPPPSGENEPPAVDTGRLRGSITHRVEDGTAYVGTNVFYGVFLEFGTGIHAENGDGRKTPWVYTNRKGEKIFTHGSYPHPFLRPALRINEELILDYMKKYARGEV